MPYKAVIFDLDGTLLNTLDDIADSMNFALSSRGLPVHDTEKYKYFVGDGVTSLVQRALPSESPPELREEILAAYTDRYGAHCADRTRPYPGVPAMLRALNEHGLKLAVLSNKPHTSTLAVVAQYFNDVEFATVLGARDGVPVKPDPAGALELAEVLVAEPSEILYLGDTAVDMRTAISAGMTPVGALWGFRTRGELEENGAEFVLEHPADILKLL